MRNLAVVLLLAVVTVPIAGGAAEPAVLAGCSEFARATSLTWEDPGEECSDFFILEAPATVVVRLDATTDFVGTLGAALVMWETSVASFKRTFVGGSSIDGPVEMAVLLGPGNWRLRAFAGVTPRQPCAPEPPVIPGLLPVCNLVPGAAVGDYAVTVRLA